MRISPKGLMIVIAGLIVCRILVTMGSSPETPAVSSGSRELTAEETPVEASEDDGTMVFEDTWSAEDEGRESLAAMQTFNSAGEPVSPVDSYFDSHFGYPVGNDDGYGYGYGAGYGYRAGYGFVPLWFGLSRRGYRSRGSSRVNGLFAGGGSGAGSTRSKTAAAPVMRSSAASGSQGMRKSASSTSGFNSGSSSTNTGARPGSGPASTGGVASGSGSPAYRSGLAAKGGSSSTNTSSSSSSSSTAHPAAPASSSSAATHPSRPAPSSSPGSSKPSSSSSSRPSSSSSSSSRRR